MIKNCIKLIIAMMIIISFLCLSDKVSIDTINIKFILGLIGGLLISYVGKAIDKI